MPDQASKGAETLSIWQTLRQGNSEDQLLELLCESIQRQTGCDGCDLFLRENGEELVMRASTYTPELTHRCRLGPGVGLCGKVLRSGISCFLQSGAAKHPDNVLYPGVDDSHIEAIAVFPINSPDGSIGIVLLFWHEAQKVDEETTRQWETWIAEAGEVLSTAQKFMRIGSQANRLDAVSQVAQKIASSPYLEEILQLLVNMTAQQFGYTVCTVRLLDDRRNELVLRATQASARAYRRKPSIKLGESIAGKALGENKVVIVRDVLVDPDYIGHDLAAEQGLRSMICVPLVMQELPLGVMSCYTSDVRDFAIEEIEALETIAQQASFAIERARIQVRSTLLQEMNHRVKNNLQQITSLLRLQMRHGSDPQLVVSLQETLSRISAIAAVHDLLSRDDLDHVGLRTLAETLVHLQKESIVLPHHEIDYQIRGDDVFLGTAQATQIALILNELLQNAVEHGFESSRKGSIHITIENRGGDLGLWVSNLGNELPPDFDFHASTSLGLTIVTSLVKNLGGSFVLEDRLGWTVAEVRCHLIGAE